MSYQGSLGCRICTLNQQTVTRVSFGSQRAQRHQTYGELSGAEVISLSPVVGVLDFLIICLDPLVHPRRHGHADHVDDIHCKELASAHSKRGAARHTMVRSDQLLLTMVWLSPLHGLLSIDGAGWKLVGRVHPIDARVDMMLIGSPDLEDTGDPIVVILLGCWRAPRSWRRLLSLDC